MSVFEDVPIYEVENYWSKRPCNVRHSTAPVGTPEYFDEVRERKYLVESHIQEFADFGAWENKRVLEVGCGIGTAMRGFVEAGANYTGIDLSIASIALAKQQQAATNATLYHWDAEKRLSPWDAASFDLIYSFGVIHHSPHPESIVANMRYWIKNDGTVKVMVYNRFSWKTMKLVKWRWWKADQIIAMNSEAEEGCPVTYTYTRRSLRNMFERNGFRVQQISVDHIFPYQVKDYVQYKYTKTWPIRILPIRMFRWLERRLGWHLMITAVPC